MRDTTKPFFTTFCCCCVVVSDLWQVSPFHGFPQGTCKDQLTTRVPTTTLSWLTSPAHLPQCRQEQPQRRWVVSAKQQGVLGIPLRCVQMGVRWGGRRGAWGAHVNKHLGGADGAEVDRKRSVVNCFIGKLQQKSTVNSGLQVNWRNKPGIFFTSPSSYMFTRYSLPGKFTALFDVFEFRVMGNVFLIAACVCVCLWVGVFFQRGLVTF